MNQYEKITITFENLPEGGVKVVSDPTFEMMLKADQSGHKLTSAHGYALSALNHIRNVSKKQEDANSLIVKIPGLRI